LKHLNEIETSETALPTLKDKIEELAVTASRQIDHLTERFAKNEAEEKSVVDWFLLKFSDQFRDIDKLINNVTKLVTHGSTATKRVIIPLFLASFRDKYVEKVLNACSDYSKVRRENAAARFPTTKVNPYSLDSAVAFVYANAEFRPGRLRNPTLRGVKLKKLPLYKRYTGIDQLFAEYIASPKIGPPLGYHSFVEVVKTLTLPGGFNQGLSYYYTDFIDAMALLEIAIERLFEIADEVEAGEEVRKLIGQLLRASELTSKYLRHQLYSRLKDADYQNACVHVRWALGDLDTVGPQAVKEDDPLLLVYILQPLIYKISNELLEWLEIKMEEEIESDTESDSESDTKSNSKKIEAFEDLEKEIKTFDGMADILQKECQHYVNHLVRGWWQETEGYRMKEKLLQKPGVIFITIDHKSKTLPKKRKEAMSDYFGKHGMSDLGCMFEWNAGEEGTFFWFTDIIMNNVKSQRARDVMPGLETILKVLESKEFLEKYRKTGQTRPKEIVLVSDNAFTNKVYTPFIALLNSRNSNLKITHWLNNEAQRGKSFLDTHFRYVNDQCNSAVLAKNRNLNNPRAFYGCLCERGGIKHSSVILPKPISNHVELFWRHTGPIQTHSSSLPIAKARGG